MRFKTVQEVKTAILNSGEHWRIPFMDFVDELRYSRDYNLIKTPFTRGDEKIDSLLASTIEYLCHELHMETPDWTWDVPACIKPWFVSGYENLKAISIVESPAFFRRRKIFVLENFLSRV